MTRSKRVKQVMKIRQSLVDEALRDGATLEGAEAYATLEIVSLRKIIKNQKWNRNEVFRLVASQC